MKAMKRLFCLSIAILLLCAPLTACAPQQEEVSELDLIKAEWQRYVVDRTVELSLVHLLGSSLDSNSKTIDGRTTISEILDICKLFDVSSLNTLEETPSFDITLMSPLNVLLLPEVSDTDKTDRIEIHFRENGEVYFHFVIENIDYWAYVSEWNVYEEINEYRRNSEEEYYESNNSIN